MWSVCVCVHVHVCAYMHARVCVMEEERESESSDVATDGIWLQSRRSVLYKDAVSAQPKEL